MRSIGLGLGALLIGVLWMIILAPLALPLALLLRYVGAW